MIPYMAMLRFWRLVIGRSDDEFWGLTPREYDAWVSPYLRQDMRVKNADFESLMARYPDERNEDG